jgi:ribosomal RNA assembly protein
MRIVKLPGKRLAAFKESAAKIAEESGAKLSVNEDGNAEIEGDGGSEWIAEQVVKAIAGGFDYKVARKMFSDEFYLECVDLELVLGSPKVIERQTARIIGTEGKAKRIIAELSGAFLSIFENKVYFLGRFEEVKAAKEAVMMLLDGKTHTSVYSFLEKSKKEL